MRHLPLFCWYRIPQWSLGTVCARMSTTLAAHPLMPHHLVNCQTTVQALGCLVQSCTHHPTEEKVNWCLIELYSEQKCIPVGYVPPTAVAVSHACPPFQCTSPFTTHPLPSLPCMTPPLSPCMPPVNRIIDACENNLVATSLEAVKTINYKL